MVYHHRTVTCPNCKKVSDRRTTVDNEQLKGSPFRVCPHCNEVYFDFAYHEPAISVFEDKGGEVNFWSIIWALISNAGLIFCIYELITGHASFDGSFIILFFVTLGLAVLFDFGIYRLIRNRINAKQYHQKNIDYLEGKTGTRTADISESMERLSSREYLDALKARGVYIPEYFYKRLRNNQESNYQVPETKLRVNSSMVAEETEEGK